MEKTNLRMVWKDGIQRHVLLGSTEFSFPNQQNRFCSFPSQLQMNGIKFIQNERNCICLGFFWFYGNWWNSILFGTVIPKMVQE